MRIEAGLLLTYAKVTGGRAPVLVVQARSNPDLKWEFVVRARRTATERFGPPAASCGAQYG